MLYLSPSRVAWANGRSLQWGGARITGADVSGLEIDLSTSETVARTPDGQPAHVETSGVSPDLVRGLLDSLASGAAKVPPREESPVRVARAAWTARLEDGEPVRRLKLANLDQDATPEILAAADRAGLCPGGGDTTWRHDRRRHRHRVAVVRDRRTVEERLCRRRRSVISPGPRLIPVLIAERQPRPKPRGCNPWASTALDAGLRPRWMLGFDRVGCWASTALDARHALTCSSQSDCRP